VETLLPLLREKLETMKPTAFSTFEEMAIARHPDESSKLRAVGRRKTRHVLLARVLSTPINLPE
jgi:hypothetical protein